MTGTLGRAAGVRLRKRDKCHTLWMSLFFKYCFEFSSVFQFTSLSDKETHHRGSLCRLTLLASSSNDHQSKKIVEEFGLLRFVLQIFRFVYGDALISYLESGLNKKCFTANTSHHKNTVHMCAQMERKANIKPLQDVNVSSCTQSQRPVMTYRVQIQVSSLLEVRLVHAFSPLLDPFILS